MQAKSKHLAVGQWQPCGQAVSRVIAIFADQVVVKFTPDKIMVTDVLLQDERVIGWRVE